MDLKPSQTPAKMKKTENLTRQAKQLQVLPNSQAMSANAEYDDIKVTQIKIEVTEIVIQSA